MNHEFFHPVPVSKLAIFFMLMFGVMAMYFIKSLTCLVTGIIFKAWPVFEEYVHNFYMLNKNLGLYLFVFNLFIPFVNPVIAGILLKAGLGVVIFFYLLRILRGFQIIFHKEVSIYYMILYFCTLEVLPIIILYDWVKSFL
jgi:hypothetical protein